MKSAGESIVHALADSDWMVREVAAEALGSSKDGMHVAGALVHALSDEYWQVRLKAVRSLGMLKVGHAVRAIGECLDHPQANLRKECAAALGEIAEPAGWIYLEKQASDPDPDVRKNVQWAMQRISAGKAAVQ